MHSGCQSPGHPSSSCSDPTRVTVRAGSAARATVPVIGTARPARTRAVRLTAVVAGRRRMRTPSCRAWCLGAGRHRARQRPEGTVSPLCAPAPELAARNFREAPTSCGPRCSWDRRHTGSPARARLRTQARVRGHDVRHGRGEVARVHDGGEATRAGDLGRPAGAADDDDERPLEPVDEVPEGLGRQPPQRGPDEDGRRAGPVEGLRQGPHGHPRAEQQAGHPVPGQLGLDGEQRQVVLLVVGAAEQDGRAGDAEAVGPHDPAQLALEELAGQVLRLDAERALAPALARSRAATARRPPTTRPRSRADAASAGRDGRVRWHRARGRRRGWRRPCPRRWWPDRWGARTGRAEDAVTLRRGLRRARAGDALRRPRRQRLHRSRAAGPPPPAPSS